MSYFSCYGPSLVGAHRPPSYPSAAQVMAEHPVKDIKPEDQVIKKNPRQKDAQKEKKP